MKKIALAVAFAASMAVPASAADFIPGPSPAPWTCMDYVNSHYHMQGHHAILHAPFYAVHATLCHVFHHDYHAAPHAAPLG